MKGKKIALIAVLLAVIAAAAVFAVKRIQSERKTPVMFWEWKSQKIDMNSLEVFTETARDWTTQYAPDASGRYKNPRTGEYTMVQAMPCASCGQLIPVPQLPAGLEPTKLGRGSGRPDRAAMMAQMKAVMEIERAYKCPRCGKNAFAFGPIPSPPKSK